MPLTPGSVQTPSNSPLLSEPSSRSDAAEMAHERWAHVHVNWTAVWVGALAAFASVLVFGLIGIAVGAHLVGPEHRVVDLTSFHIGTIIFSVCGAFFAFAIGGWIAGKVAGILHSEPAMLHGAFCWLVALPILIAAAGLGAGSSYGGWYGGLTGAPAWGSATNAPFTRPEPLGVHATAEEITTFRNQQEEYTQQVRKWNDDTPRAIRNGALGAVTALLLGLIGSVVGGWMASGEPMNFAHYRTRKARYHQAV
jgi:uncharacterized membrane protein YeaQ/YmgE (transglycosylase-associated protein family)